MLFSNDLFQYDLDFDSHTAVITKILMNDNDVICLPESIQHEGSSFKIKFIEVEAFKSMNKNSILYITPETRIEHHILSKRAMAASLLLDIYIRDDLRYFIESHIRYMNQAIEVYMNENKILMGNFEFSIRDNGKGKYLILDKFKSRFLIYNNYKTMGMAQIDGTSIPHNLELILPESLLINGNNYYLKEIAPNAFCNAGEIGSVVIPNSVTSIGKYAFYGCACMRKVLIPSSVTSIGDFAFSAHIQEYDLPCGFLEEVINESYAFLPEDVFWGQEFKMNGKLTTHHRAE